MNIKEYKSELGKLYQSKREEAPLQKIVFEIYSLFKFWIESGEMLPISISAKDYQRLTDNQIELVIIQLADKGCKVEYVIEKRINSENKFVLVDLV
jgi:hypothetical protein